MDLAKFCGGESGVSATIGTQPALTATGNGRCGVALGDDREVVVTSSDGESLLANALLASLDSGTELEIVRSEQIWGMCESFVDAVEARIVIMFYSKRALVRKIYRYISKLSIRRALRYDFYDNKLMTTNLSSVSEEFPFLFEQVKNAYRAHIGPFSTF